MKIGMNALFFKQPASGTGQYQLQLLQALAEIDTQNTYLLLGPQALPKPIKLASNMYYHAAPVAKLAARSENIEKLIWEQITSPRAAKLANVDLLHIPYFAPPLRARVPFVVTVHDVIPWHLPLYRAGAKVEAYTRLIERAIRHATLIITVSQHAREDIINTLHLPAERIRVIYQAVGSEYQPLSDPAVLEAARARYGLKPHERYVFYLGGLDVRKNVPQLVRAFARVVQQLNDPDLKLLISGNPDRQRGPLFPDPRLVAAELGIAERVLCRFVEDADKPALYSAASVFAFPSLYEGFGLTPLEAMACGTPVVCSNRTSLPEVVGDAALNVDPDDTEALAFALLRVLNDGALQADLRARSLAHAAGFNWRKTASETLAAYEAVYQLAR